jgi:hypothetical protein
VSGGNGAGTRESEEHAASEGTAGYWERGKVPLTARVAAVPFKVPSQQCAVLIAHALQKQEEADTGDPDCQAAIRRAFEIETNAASARLKMPPLLPVRGAE